MQGMDGRSGSSPVIRHSFEMVLVNQHNLLRGFFYVDLNCKRFSKQFGRHMEWELWQKEAGLFARPLDSLVGPPGFEPRTQGL